MYLSVLSLALLLNAGPVVNAPGDLENAFQNLKEAIQSKKDAAQVKKLAAETYALTQEALSGPAAEGEVEGGAPADFLVFARDAEAYTEYALYVTAIQSPPATMVDLISTLEQQNPESKYLDEAYAPYFVALNQTGAASKVPGIAAKAIANFPENEDLLMVLAGTAMSRRQSDRALAYSQRLLAALNKHSKPERMSPADWERKRNLELGQAHWIAGVVYSEKTRYFQADAELRAALPLIQGNQEMLGTALFNLGVANYQLGRTVHNKARVLEAVKFSEQAAGIPGPLAQQAWHNAVVMKSEAQAMR